ncbi:MAG: shikimate dehydrogenase [Acidimicrobiales bacterium]|nr:shikimate dehydrogenase [Acidimicrobiales bacterium]
MITGRTRVAAVIGDPIDHSLSPELHNAAFAAAGLDWVFVAWPVPPGGGAAAVDAMRVSGLAGMSVTMPHKDAVADAADECSDAVAALGAANCLVRLDGGRIRAENTDGAGFLAGLRDDAGTGVEGRRVGLIGAGGAARAVAQACGVAGAGAVVVVNRTAERAAACAALAGPVGRVGAASDLATVDIVVNASSIGMGDDAAMPCDPALLHGGQVVVDLIYTPLETAWLAAVRDAGIEAHNGLSMLVHQAAEAFTLWTGADAPVSAMRDSISNKFS